MRQQPRGKFRTCTFTWARLIKISCEGQFDTQFAMKATEYNHTEFMTKKKLGRESRRYTSTRWRLIQNIPGKRHYFRYKQREGEVHKKN